VILQRSEHNSWGMVSSIRKVPHDLLEPMIVPIVLSESRIVGLKFDKKSECDRVRGREEMLREFKCCWQLSSSDLGPRDPSP
jgi:hypothetical protein